MATKITQAQSARLLGISQVCLSLAIKKGDGPPFYPGKLPGVVGRSEGYFLQHEVARWYKKREKRIKLAQQGGRPAGLRAGIKLGKRATPA